MDEGKWAILFDLDQTLVITSSIEHLRKKREWSTVYNSFDKTHLPPGTKIFIDKIRALSELGVVTISPRPYAEKLIKYHKLNLPVVIAYHDVTQIKPNPECLIKACEKLHILPGKCIYIGDKIEDLLTAKAAGVVPLGITWDKSLDREISKKITNNIFGNWEDVFSKIREIISQGD